MAEEEQKSSAGGGKGKIVIIIIAALVVVLAGLAAAFFFLTKAPDESAKDANAAATAPSEQAAPAVSSEASAKYLRIGPVFQLDQFIVNLLSQGGRRYLKINIGLEMTTPNLENELTAKRAPVRDIVIEILTSKSPEDISTTRGKEKLKEEIMQRLNEILVDGKIRSVFLTDMAIQ